MNHVANAKIGVYCRGTKELQERAFLRGQTIPPALNLPKLLTTPRFDTAVRNPAVRNPREIARQCISMALGKSELAVQS